MEDNLDNELRDRIREVFDNYDDASADAGWDLLRERFPEKKKRRIVPLWWYSAAAVLLIALSLFLFYPRNTVKQQVNAALPQKTHDLPAHDPAQQPTEVAQGPDSAAAHQEHLAVSKPNNGANHQRGHHDQLTPSDTGGSTQQQIAGIKKPVYKPAETNTQHHLTTSEKPQIVRLRKTKTTKPAEGSFMENGVSLASGNKFINTKNTSISSDQSNHNNGEQPDGLSVDKAVNGQAIADNVTDKSLQAKTDSAASSAPSSVAMQKPQKTPGTEEDRTKALLRIMADDKAKQLAADKTKTAETVKKQKAFALSVYAATYFNYAKGSTSDLNVGAGFTSDFSLNKNIKLSTGLAIAQNTLRYENSNDVPAQINNKVADVVNSHANTFAYSSAAALATYPAPMPTVKSSNANLVGLDIPINIKYDFNPKKSEAYIMAGISSGTYINETYRSAYSYRYNNPGTSTFAIAQLANDSQPTLESTTKQHFNTFDFAKTLNVSFGVGYPLGKYSLIVEPFVKYPLSGLGSQDIRFGAGGVNLKFNFRSIKK